MTLKPGYSLLLLFVYNLDRFIFNEFGENIKSRKLKSCRKLLPKKRKVSVCTFTTYE